jgi:hypothetical protein
MNAHDEENLFGDAPVAMRVCPKCVRGEMIYGSLIEPPPEEIKALRSWCSKACCKVCRFEWYVCRVCPNIRERLDTQRKLSSHSYKYHRECHPVTRSAKCSDPIKKRKKNVPVPTTNRDTTTTNAFKIARKPKAQLRIPSSDTRDVMVVNPLIFPTQLPNDDRNPVNDMTPS